jgi:uncharacterized membrane protein
MLPPFFFLPFIVFIFIALFFGLLFLFALIQVGAITVAFTKLGLSSSQVFWVLLGTLLGSMINIPVYSREVAAGGRDIDLKGVWSHYRKQRWGLRSPGRQTVAVNLGGALIPGGLSLYFMAQVGVSAGMILSLAAVALITYRLARPIAGVGIGVPFLVPPLVTVLCAWLFAPAGAQAHVAYIAGSLGTLIGADVLHLANKRTLSSLDSPLLSIGGAGTFDGIFLAGIIAVLLA